MNTKARKLLKVVRRHAGSATLVTAAVALLATPYPYLAVLPGLAVLALLWFGRRDMVPYLFYCIVLLIPFGAFRGVGPVQFHWLFAGTLAVLVLLEILIRKKIPNEVRRNRLLLLLLIFYLVNVLASLGSKFPERSVQFMVLLASGYLLVVLGIIVTDRKGFSKILPGIIVGSVFAGSLLAVLGATFQLTLFLSPDAGRVLGGASDPNNMALMVIFSIPLAVYFFMNTRRRRMQLFLLLIIIVNVVTVMATFSRGGAIVLCFAGLLILWELRSRITPRNLGLLLGLGGLVVTALLLLTPEAYSQRLQSIHTADDFSMRRRASYILVARDLVVERPVLGSGPNTFPLRYAESEIGRGFKRKEMSGEREAHNTYLEVLTGSGITGLMFFLIVLLYALHSFTRARRRFLALGEGRLALLTTMYRASFLTLLVYLLIFSDQLHKYLLVSLAVSQIALRLAATLPEQEPTHACR